MRTLRWIAFVPAAVIMGLLMGKLGDILGVLIFHGKNWSACLFSGLVAAGSFILAGLKVAPLRNAVSKWILVSFCLIFAFMSIIGGLLSNEPVSAFAGLGMILAASPYLFGWNGPFEQDPASIGG